MERRSFFKERTVAQIQSMNVCPVLRPKGFIQTLAEIDESKDSIELVINLIPKRVMDKYQSEAEASRHYYKYGRLIELDQPNNSYQARRDPRIPLAIRQKDFSNKLSKEEELIDYTGYSWRPVSGVDRQPRVVHFSWLLEGQRLFAEAETEGVGIEVRSYDDAQQVKEQGARIACKVPSRSRKEPYTVILEHVPVEGSNQRKSIIYSLKPKYVGQAPLHSLFNIKYAADLEKQDVVTFYPHDIAAYIAVVGHYWKQHNMTPIEMNPFALFSRKGAELYKKLCNNVVIMDLTLHSKNNYRKLHIAEKDIMMARAIGVLGIQIAYWNPFEGDGKLKDYNWSVK